MDSSLNRDLLRQAAQHLDTVGERLYESTLMAFNQRAIPKTLEQRARLMRIAKELREIAEQ